MVKVRLFSTTLIVIRNIHFYFILFLWFWETYQTEDHKTLKNKYVRLSQIYFRQVCPFCRV